MVDKLLLSFLITGFVLIVIFGIGMIMTWPKEPWTIELRKLKPKHPDEEKPSVAADPDYIFLCASKKERKKYTEKYSNEL